MLTYYHMYVFYQICSTGSSSLQLCYALNIFVRQKKHFKHIALYSDNFSF